MVIWKQPLLCNLVSPPNRWVYLDFVVGHFRVDLYLLSMEFWILSTCSKSQQFKRACQLQENHGTYNNLISLPLIAFSVYFIGVIFIEVYNKSIHDMSFQKH